MDALSLSIALVCGFAARLINLPPLVGFLLAGFLLNFIGFEGGEALERISEFGVTLLLFTIGLKLRIRNLLRPQVWAVASLHMLVVVVAFSLGLYALALVGLSMFATVTFTQALILAFALSFSSTVFAVKVLEEKGEMGSLHGTIAIGILIMQDLFAVVFLAFAAGKVPTALGIAAVIALIVFRRALLVILERCGHGEILLLFGVLLAIGGAQAFDAVGVKGDLGALFLGCLLAGHEKVEELSKALLSFKELFLVGFFLSIGLSGDPSPEILGVALLLALVMPIKVVLFFWLLSRFRMRARSSLLASFSLANYSEFGLICCSIAVSMQWIVADWLLVLALAMSLTFVFASALNSAATGIYRRFAAGFDAFEIPRRLPEEADLDPGDATIVVFGVGRIGAGAYDYFRERFGDVVLGVDSDADVVRENEEDARNVIRGDATDSSFWKRIQQTSTIKVVLLTMSSHSANLEAVKGLAGLAQSGFLVGAAARYPDDARELREAGVQVVLDFYEDAGSGLAEGLLDHPLCETTLEGLEQGPTPSK